MIDYSTRYDVELVKDNNTHTHTHIYRERDSS